MKVEFEPVPWYYKLLAVIAGLAIGVVIMSMIFMVMGVWA